MSDPKIISPMLDGFAIGGSLSSHDGVSCYPAMKENSDQKYILKVISIPGSQAQLDALLLTGAYKDPAAALDYFKALADEVVAEAEALKKLSKLEGFLPYESWQVVPMENNDLGYQVYLLGSYKQTLDRFMRRSPMTHLAAVNLGLDLCAALAICRKSGFLYVDLKPENIFVSDDREYRIGDLGFVKLDSLKYTSLPSKYRSAYTAPDQDDTLATLNETVDTYAAGMILYQVFNNGQLPSEPNTAETPLPAPLNADYEIAEIIMKAVAPDPRDRWDNPMAMGQALAAYMQRNTVNDTPLNPHAASISPIEESAEEPETPAEEPIVQESAEETSVEPAPAVDDDAAPSDTAAQEDTQQTVTEEASTMLSMADTLISMPAVDLPVSDATINLSVALPSPDAAPAAVSTPLSVMEEDDRRTMVVDTERVKHANRGIQIFDGEDSADFAEEIPQQRSPAEKPRKKFNPLVLVLVLLLVSALAIGGLFFYRTYYLQSIDGLKITGTNNQLTVSVDTEIEDGKLTVVCSDTHGNSKRQTLKDGEVIFTDLTPGTSYTIQIEIDGFHKLTGIYRGSHHTASETKITDLKVNTGPEDGSVILDFSITGPEKSPDWQVSYHTEGEEAQTVPFNGHSVTLTGLTVGKEYTFELIPPGDIYLTGENVITFTASKIVLAENLKITTFTDGNLTAQWQAPADSSVASWLITCYSEDGIKQELTSSETSVTFTDVQVNKGYTVEIKAAGMSKSAPPVSVTANPVTITAITVDAETPEVLNVTWEYQGDAPLDGWHLMYTLDNNTDTRVVRSETNTATIDLRIPGSTYHLTVQAANGTTIFCEDFTFTCPDAESFNKHALPRSKIATNLLVTPSKANWSYKNVGKQNHTDTFKSGKKVSMLLRATVDFYLPREDTSILCYVKDSDGNVISSTIYTDQDTWYNMWNNTNYHYFEMDIQNTPTTPGKYTVYLLFNGNIATTRTFTITE